MKNLFSLLSLLYLSLFINSVYAQRDLIMCPASITLSCKSVSGLPICTPNKIPEEMTWLLLKDAHPRYRAPAYYTLNRMIVMLRKDRMICHYYDNRIDASFIGTLEVSKGAKQGEEFKPAYPEQWNNNNECDGHVAVCQVSISKENN